jgi:hypothetical protein
VLHGYCQQLAGLLLLCGPAALAGPVQRAANRAEQPPTPAAVPAPVITITLLDRHGHAVPVRTGCQHTGGGNIDVVQPTPNALVVTMTGAAVACAHPCKDSLAAFDFDLEQCFELAIENGAGKRFKMTLEGRVLGLLRSPRSGKGMAEESGACATVTCVPTELLTVCAPPHSVSGGDNLSVNCREGPVSAFVLPGKFTLRQKFHLAASSPRSLLPCKAASAEFAPDPALDPLWISYWEPFHGAIKKDFGFQVVLRVVAE